MHKKCLWGSVDSPRGHLIISPQFCLVRMTIPHKDALVRIGVCVLLNRLLEIIESHHLSYAPPPMHNAS